MTPARTSAAYRRRAGFALLPVLAIVAGGTALGVVLVGLSRDAAGASENRVALRRTAWLAEGCAQSVIALESTLLAVPEPGASASWRALDSALADPTHATSECGCQLTALGTALSINQASSTQVLALLSGSGIPSAQAESLTAALVDWRDTDQVVSKNGAEAGWYHSQGRATPRNGPFGAMSELALVRGFGDPRIPWHLLTTEGGRLYLARAPSEVIAASVGLEAGAVEALRAQSTGPLRTEAVRPLIESGRTLARGVPVALDATDDPDGWVITCAASSGVPEVTSTIELLIARSGPRVALVRRRSWP